MKIGVLSDTHIPERAAALPAKLLAGMKGVDLIIHAGDLSELHVLDALRKVCPDVRAVAGNMDPAEVRRLLPEKLLLKAGDFSIGVAHGYGPPGSLPQMMRELFKKDRVDIIIYGHSHQPTCIDDSVPFLFNPGSPTDTIFAPYKSFGMITIDDKIGMEIVKL
jgi:uncharacterized protein